MRGSKKSGFPHTVREAAEMACESHRNHAVSSYDDRYHPIARAVVIVSMSLLLWLSILGVLFFPKANHITLSLLKAIAST